MRTLLLSTVLLLPCLPASAQDGRPVDPFEVTCSMLLTMRGEHPSEYANTINWMAGYFYGWFWGVEGSNVTPDSYDVLIRDLDRAVWEKCPDEPDMPAAFFTNDLANDLADRLAGQQ